MNDQTKKAPVRLNFFDILLIVLAVLIVAAGAALVIFNTQSASDEVRIQYTVLVKELPEEIVIKAEPGESVVDTVKLGTIGEVVSYEVIKATYDEFNQETKALVHGTYDDLVSVYFTFAADAEKSDTAYMVGNQRVAVGAQIFFRTPSFTGYGFVTDVTETAE
ncbi:MAG: DUF4330 domain-containing protein [Clostridia bacterium]|nr:DUF4330 domain-containing protein [Clostridia bacterium]